MFSVRYFIGLSQRGDVPSAKIKKARRFIALRIILGAFQSATVLEARGFWKGASEPTLVVEVLSDHGGRKFRALVRDVGKRLRVALEQESVGVAITFSEWELV